MTKDQSNKKEVSEKEAAIAVIKTGGKQYLVSVGENLKVEKLEAEEGAVLEFEDILEGKQVSAKVAGHGKGKKVSGRVFINKVRRSRFPRGHRQQYTELVIESIK